MVARRKIKVTILRLSLNGEYKYPWHSREVGEAEFTVSFAACYFAGRKFLKDKESAHGGNYIGAEDGDSYRVWQW